MYYINYINTLTTAIMVDPNFLGHSLKELKLMIFTITNNLFMNFIHDNYTSSTLILTDDSITPSRAGYAFYILDLQIQSSGYLSPHISCFTAEGSAILKATFYIGTLSLGKYLIVSDSQFVFLAIVGNVFSSNDSCINL